MVQFESVLELWIFMAFVIERLTECVMRIFNLKVDGPKKYISHAISAFFALVICIGANLDFFQLIDLPFSIPYVGVVITAIFMASGSAVLHDVISWVSKSKNLLKSSQ